MHEISVAENLSSIVLEAAVKEKLSRVTRVNICFGQMIQIVPEIFEFAFREAVRNTIAQDAEVDLEILPVQMRCKHCGSDFLVMENYYFCNMCSSNDLEIIQGKELLIKSIEGE